ncbi:DUF2304 domain-containing protein [Bacillus sp. BRMEA1]|uniref:DUF2304 domain-containing protein n=1 Tax=Neobacillus endophyticus TaxID=2738405 RepID=UPI0015635E8C|nr:DUF2304 domain-containing protein [Neobacillus endophyticus]NRD77990.1 DUF2304 domain-containing protein [Neobacillus endophyticus]
MNSFLQIFLIICALLFLIGVVSLLLKNKISERYSVIWLAGSLLIFFIAGNPKLLDRTAKVLGIAYPPSLLFLLSTLILLLFCLYQTIQITKLTNKVKDISQYLALHQFQEQEVEGRITEVKSGYEQGNYEY